MDYPGDIDQGKIWPKFHLEGLHWELVVLLDKISKYPGQRSLAHCHLWWEDDDESPW